MRERRFVRILSHILILFGVLTSCTHPLSGQPTNSTSPTRLLEITSVSQAQSNSPSTVTTLGPSHSSPVQVSTITPTFSQLQISENAEPIIFIGSTLSIDQKCGQGDVVAVDGHILRATPRILKGNTNFLEKEPEGTQVDIIDCRVWIDKEGMSWLAVRTAQKKLGWMFIQGDIFVVTIYPVVSMPRSITGIPAGSTVAYVPPSECKKGPVSGIAIATSIGLDFIPVVGDVKMVGEAVTGCDMITGQSLGNWRWFGLLGLVGLAEIATLSHEGEGAVEAARAAENLDGSLLYGDEATMAALRKADTAADFASEVRQAGRSVEVEKNLAEHLEETGDVSDQALRDLAKFEKPCSFLPETPVMTSNGLKPINHLAIGEQVLAYDEKQKKTGYYPISAVFSHVDETTITLTLGSDQVVTTPDHLFHTSLGWKAAGDLIVGEQITSAIHTATTVRNISIEAHKQVMYNLGVAQAHTFFVGTGEWLVHNSCRNILRKNMIASGLTPDWAADDVPWQAHHVIPVEFEDDAFVKRAVDGGWDFNGASNGIALPSQEDDAARLGLTQHNGPHPDYSSNVGRELQILEDRAVTEQWDNSRAIMELEKLIRSLKITL